MLSKGRETILGLCQQKPFNYLPVARAIMRGKLRLAPLVFGLIFAMTGPAIAETDTHSPEPKWKHATTLIGDSFRHGPDFQHFDAVNPNAPKGGRLRLSASGGFDTFNPFVARGRPASGIGLLNETLFTASLDEPATEYGLIAEAMRYPKDSSWVEFRLKPTARFHDGHPIDVEDVIFSFDILVEKGAPFYRAYFSDVAKVSSPAPAIVRFDFRQKK